MLLIYPPVAKPCEPPAGIAKLAATLRNHGYCCTLLDANLEGLLTLFDSPVASHQDTWTHRAIRGLSANLDALRDIHTYQKPDRYRRAVADVGRVLSVAGTIHKVYIDLADYQDPHLTPTKSADLLQAAGQAEKNLFYPYFSTRLTKLVETYNPTLVGISLNYLSQAICSFAIAGFLKKRFPNLPLVLGGGLVTSWMRNPNWKNPFEGLIDHLVAGPGEEALLELLKGDKLDECERSTRSRTTICHEPTFTRTGHKDSLPLTTDYTGLPLSTYLSPGLVLPYAASTGCWWNKCSFCPERAERNPYGELPVSVVLAEVDRLVTKNSPTLLHLLDNAVSPALLAGLAERPPGVPWYGFSRIIPQLADVDFCLELARSGCVMLKLGLESGDQNVLDTLNKGIDLSLVVKVLTALKVAGITTYVYLLFGTPAENLSSAGRTLDFVVKHSEKIGYLNLAIFNMPVGSPEAERFASGCQYDGDLSLYTGFVHPSGWGRREVRRFLNREFKRHPDIADIVRRDPPQFTSNHAPFQALRLV